MQNLRYYVKRRRLDRGWSASELARRAGIKRDTIRLIESNKTRAHASTLAVIASALECSVDDLRRRPSQR